ncbi:alanine dehydrogenase [Paenibacillus sp. 1P07SE]|uniref:alanine dehydrogenase n=1 Tax=Paenibacillus sp. 1P07SE TaxID=3132209 RepID=UPI0039A42CEC
MIIGIPREVMDNENRVSLAPSGAAELTRAGHRVMVERGAGEGSGYTDEHYAAAGASLAEGAAEVWGAAELIVKVKEPQPSEYGLFREGLLLFTYLHLAVEPKLALALMEKKVTAIAYETVSKDGALPLLTPMSEVAGRMAAQIGARLLEQQYGGKGILLGGVPGVKRGKVTIIGGGVVGMNAALIASGLGAQVVILEQSPDRIRQLQALFGRTVDTLMSDRESLEEHVAGADLAIGAVLVPGAKAPRLVDASIVKNMSPASVILDVAIDQGGIFETIDRKTSYTDPTYTRYGVVHYAVANMPGAVPRTSTMALTNATLPYVRLIAEQGIRGAVLASPPLAEGVNAAAGHLTHAAVARDLGLNSIPVQEALAR